MNTREQKALLMAYTEWLVKNGSNDGYTGVNEIVDTYLATLTPVSERYTATMAFFDKLPEGLREMAKESYEDGFTDYVPLNLSEGIKFGFSWKNNPQGIDFWNCLYEALHYKAPTITLNGTTYDLTKCYE